MLIANKSQYDQGIESCVELIGKLVNVGVEVKVDDLKTALLTCDDNEPHFPINCLIKHLDISLNDEIQREMPDLLVNVFSLFLTNDKYSEKSWLMETMTILLDKFELDINYSSATHGSFPVYNNELLLICTKSKRP